MSHLALSPDSLQCLQWGRLWHCWFSLGNLTLQEAERQFGGNALFLDFLHQAVPWTRRDFCLLLVKKEMIQKKFISGMEKLTYSIFKYPFYCNVHIVSKGLHSKIYVYIVMLFVTSSKLRPKLRPQSQKSTIFKGEKMNFDLHSSYWGCKTRPFCIGTHRSQLFSLPSDCCL